MIKNGITIIDHALILEDVEKHRNHACLHYSECLDKAERIIRALTPRPRGYANHPLKYSFSCINCKRGSK